MTKRKRVVKKRIFDKEIPMLDLKLATVIRLYGKPLGNGTYVLEFPLAELSKTAKSSRVMASDRWIDGKPTKSNPYGWKPLVGLTIFDPENEGHSNE